MARRTVGRRDFLKKSVLGAATLMTGADALRAGSGAGDERPNIVVILCDDLGYSDLSCYGATHIQTPNIDRLANQGLRFTQFYNCAKCGPTRASLMTGLYHHETGRLRRPDNATVAELLKTAGYRTYMSGKWHLGDFRHDKCTPVDRGFDRYFGHLGGAINYWTGEDFGSGKNLMRLDRKVYEPPEDFYSTVAMTDYAVRFLDDAHEKGDPFFLYLAYNAPHFPLHALPEDIERFRGKFMDGWDKLRKQRYERMVELGLLDRSNELPPRAPEVPPWSELSEEEKRKEDLLMAVYAAMTYRMDVGIGRVLDKLKQMGVFDNTLVMFLSDNGGCPFDFNRTPDLPPGPAKSMRSYNVEWANTSNTAFRLYKQNSHEGGISTPLVVRWPAAIEPGRITDQVGHVVDIMPTVLEVAGVEYPRAREGHDLLSLEGESFASTLRRGETFRHDPIYWEFAGNRAVRDGKWKLVGRRHRAVELYNMEEDRTEMHDLTEKHPDRTAKMVRMYDRWARRVGAKSNKACRNTPASGRIKVSPFLRDDG